jgi:hypothetical protein
MQLYEIAERINARSANYRMGNFQSLRKRLKGLSSVPSYKIFTSQTVHEEWAFHLGGRKELQFNIGLEDYDDSLCFRHGVAFSLETSHTLPDVEILLPKIERFNDYVRETASEFSDMQMWHWYKNERSHNYAIQEISCTFLRPGYFIFLGKLTNLTKVDIDNVLRDFDRLLNLYEYVEGGGTIRIIAPESDPGFRFRSGCSPKMSITTANRPERRLNIFLRHNDIQHELYKHLASLHGGENVGAEVPAGRGKKIDVVVKREDSFIFYEVKTSSCVQTCIREALSQLLEYSLWPDNKEGPGGERANKLVIVTENNSTEEAVKYLAKLRDRFGLSIYHQRFDLQRRILEEPW